MSRAVSRRRFITVCAAAAGLPLLGLPARAAPNLHRWRGTALGAEATILLHHPDGAVARRLIDRARDEIARLEKVFSLYRADSALAILNRDGALDGPPLDLAALLAECRHFSEASDGAFDVTVQPLWRLYAAHFARPGADPAGPVADDIARVLRLVDFTAVDADPARIALARPGMALTLNGIAQGYITDRVADLLRGGGIQNVLVDLGETRALGRHPSGRPWRAGLPDHGSRTIDLVDSAMATSAGHGMPFDDGGRHHHILDPRTGRSATHAAAVTVIAPRATTADAASTALSVMAPGRADAFIAAVGPGRALLKLADGREVGAGEGSRTPV
jgi:FAD:protein FMN transferase